MIEFSGYNRTYCYVRYNCEEEARAAISRLHNFPIRPGCFLAVTRSHDNKKLVLKLQPPLLPALHSPIQLREELSLCLEGVKKASFSGARSGDRVVVEFLDHRSAALARRQLVPGNV